MELSISQVAKRAGISARMLRHYDDLQLFPPSRVADNGYRWYEETSLPRLYRIVALRRSGLSLAAIAQIVSDATPETAVLRDHLVELRADRDRLNSLIATIEEHLAIQTAIEDEHGGHSGEAHRTERQTFAGRIAATFGREAAASLADDREADLSNADITHMAATGTMLFRRMATLAHGGVAPESPEASTLVMEHRATIQQHVSLTAEAYRALANLYLTDPLQRSILERIDPELPQWLATAIIHAVDSTGLATQATASAIAPGS